MDNGFEKSIVARRNVLNNSYALKEIENKIDIKGVFFEGEYRLTTRQVAAFFGWTLEPSRDMLINIMMN